MNILLTLQYDGTNFCGWQKQNNVRTVQKELEACLSKLFKKEITVRGSSRTDAGVHALSQLVLLTHKSNIPIEKLPIAINSNLPFKDLVVTKATLVSNEFHPQKNIYKKTYRYKIYNGETLNPLLRNYTEFVYTPLNIKKMQDACKYFIGKQDFKAFCSSGNTTKTTIREIYNISVFKEDENIIIIEVTGNGFLYNMVRIIAGTLIEIGNLKKSPESIKDIVISKNRINAGKTASAKGLILYETYYK